MQNRIVINLWFAIILLATKHDRRHLNTKNEETMEIGFLGDSITVGYGLKNPKNERFSHLIYQKYEFEEKNFEFAVLCDGTSNRRKFQSLL